MRAGTIPPDRLIAPYLRKEERVLARREHAELARVGLDGMSSDAVSGELYLTDQRLVHLDGEPRSIELDDIVEIGLAGNRLLLTLRGLLGAIIDTDSPAEFRAAVADSISAQRTP